MQGHLNSMSPPREMGIEVWVPANKVRPTERLIPLVGFLWAHQDFRSGFISYSGFRPSGIISCFLFVIAYYY